MANWNSVSISWGVHLRPSAWPTPPVLFLLLPLAFDGVGAGEVESSSELGSDLISSFGVGVGDGEGEGEGDGEGE